MNVISLVVYLAPSRVLAHPVPSVPPENDCSEGLHRSPAQAGTPLAVVEVAVQRGLELGGVLEKVAGARGIEDFGERPDPARNDGGPLPESLDDDDAERLVAH